MCLSVRNNKDISYTHTPLTHYIYNILLSTTFLICSCSSKEGRLPEELALQAAKGYYDKLLCGDIEGYAAGFLQGDSLVPELYHSQLSCNSIIYAEELNKLHGGLCHIEATRAQCDTVTFTDNSKQRIAQAYLCLTFCDSTHEEIVVPMVEKNENWYLR